MHAFNVFLAHETALQALALIIGFLLWIGVGAVMWRRFGWLQRAFYIGGGVLLAYYELHMTWYWFFAGVACMLVSFGLDVRTAQSAERDG